MLDDIITKSPKIQGSAGWKAKVLLAWEEQYPSTPEAAIDSSRFQAKWLKMAAGFILVLGASLILSGWNNGALHQTAQENGEKVVDSIQGMISFKSEEPLNEWISELSLNYSELGRSESQEYDWNW